MKRVIKKQWSARKLKKASSFWVLKYCFFLWGNNQHWRFIEWFKINLIQKQIYAWEKFKFLLEVWVATQNLVLSFHIDTPMFSMYIHICNLCILCVIFFFCKFRFTTLIINILIDCIFEVIIGFHCTKFSDLFWNLNSPKYHLNPKLFTIIECIFNG